MRSRADAVAGGSSCPGMQTVCLGLSVEADRRDGRQRARLPAMSPRGAACSGLPVRLSVAGRSVLPSCRTLARKVAGM